jgi:SAM-dependent methyltransferase
MAPCAERPGTPERMTVSRHTPVMSDKPKATGSGRARAYAAWARSGEDQSYAPLLDAVIELLPPPPLDVLDVGCGEGRLGNALIARGYSVVGVDLDPAMVALAVERHQAKLADATALPFAPETFPVVVTAHVLMEIAELDAALTEMRRVTRRDGILVAVIEHPFASGKNVEHYSRPHRYHWPMSFGGVDLGLGGIHRPLETYVRAFERAGFQLQSLRETTLPGFDPLSLVLSARRTDATR